VHYIHSVVVQDFVSGRACCVNKYHYVSLSRRVVMRLVHATGKTWYKVLYQHTIYVISLSNISIKTNFKQIARVELKCVQYSEGDNILCMTSHFFSFIHQCQATVFCHTFQWYDVMSKYFGRECLMQRRAILLSPQCVVIQHLVSDSDFR
jgi:hypothetical protein